MQRWIQWFGIEKNSTSHKEKWISGVGAGLSIAFIYLFSQSVLPQDAYLLVASMGASAVLLFAVPHGPLSQPWPLIVGHLISAIIGVSSALLINELWVGAAVAVGLSTLAMTYFRAIHPPGGATALTAVIGSESLHQLGYAFILSPVLINVGIILFVAVVFNALFNWRRYPSALMTQTSQKPKSLDFSHDDFLVALKSIDTFVDVNESDLKRVFELALNNAQASQLTIDTIHLGHYYSNGLIGKGWAVRQVIDLETNLQGSTGIVYKELTGNDKPTGYMTMDAFLDWAKYEMVCSNGRWAKVQSGKTTSDK